jgi:hypothetical protein
LSHQRGKRPKKQNKTKYLKMFHVQMQYSFSKFFSMQVWFGCFLIKGQEKKKVWRQVFEWLSEAVAHLPTAVSLLLLEALFMQISGVSLALT